VTALLINAEGVGPDMYVKLFVGNLAWSVDDATLEAFFQDYGNVRSARVINDRETGRSRGFGFVEMEVADVATVISQTNGRAINGREIRVNEAEDKGSRGHRSGGDRGGFGGRRY
jgi:RNA-binding proteins (RRM domain)